MAWNTFDGAECESMSDHLPKSDYAYPVTIVIIQVAISEVFFNGKFVYSH